MADKTPLRQAREAAGLSRKEAADKLGTTVHHYWQCEMPEGNPDPELLQRALSTFGVSAGGGGGDGTLPTKPSKADVGGARAMLTWVCRRCGHKMQTYPGTLACAHPCPKAGKKLVDLVLELS